MSNVTPPPASSGPTPAGTPGTVMATVNNPPKPFQNLTLGHIIEGEVIGKNNQGQTTVKTDLGILNLSLNKDLPIGTKVSLEVKTTGDVLRLVLLSAQKPGAAAPVMSAPAKPGPLPAHSPIAHAPVVDEARISSAPTSQSSPLGKIPQLAEGQRISFTISGTTSPTPAALSGKPAYQAAALFKGVASTNQGAVLKDINLSAVLPKLSQPQPGSPPPTTAPAAQPMAVDPQTANPGNPALTRLSPEALTAAQTPAASQQRQAQTPALPPQLSSAASAPSPAALQSLPQDTPVAAQVIKISPPGTTPPPLQPGQFIATVSGIGPGGQLFLTAGQLILSFPATETPLPTGTQVILTLNNAPMQTVPGLSPSTSAPVRETPFTEIFRLPALESLISTYLPRPEFALQAWGQNVLPQPGASLGTSALFWLTALFGAAAKPDAAQVLPARAQEMIRTLPDKGERLLQTLNNDLAQLSGKSAPNGPKSLLPATTQEMAGEWKMFHLPFLAEARPQPLRFYYREESANEAESAARISRLVIDLEMKQLGEIQLDNIFQGKRYDLYFRSLKPFPADHQNNLRALFSAYVDAMGYTGQMTFQAA